MLVLKLLGTDDGPTVRGMLHEGMEQYSSYDFMTKMCKYQDNGNAARKEFSRLIKDGSEYQQEVAALCRYLKFPGKGQKETPCMTIRGLQRLLMILGGKVASEFREIVEATFTRVMAGDTSLIEVINANAVSQEPLQQAFRQALAQEPVEPVLDDFCLKRKREREDMLFDVEMAERKVRFDMEMAEHKVRLEETQLRLEDGKIALNERKLALENDKLQHETKLIEHVNTSMGSINALKDWANVDQRTKVQAEDHIKNVLFNKTSSADPAANETAPLNVSIVAKELGFKCSNGQLQTIGKEMAKQYRETYSCNPPKHKQYVNGNYIPVNSYMERDRGMLERVIRDVMKSA